MKTTILTCALLVIGGVFAADEKPASVAQPVQKQGGEKYFDKRIEAWALGTVTGIQLDIGYIALEGQNSSQAVDYAQLIESALIAKNSPPIERLRSLRAEASKLTKKEILIYYDKANPVPLLQCPVKLEEAAKAQNIPKVQLADLKIGDTILVGYDAEADKNILYAAVGIEPTRNVNEDPLTKSKE